MTERAALRPFLESIENYCRGLMREDLIQLILNLATEVPSRDRIEFVAKIGTLCGKDVRVHPHEDILQKIQALKESIEERVEAIESGSSYEEYPGRESEWHRYGEEEPGMVSEEQKEDIAELFTEASDLFLSGTLDEARTVYAALLTLVGVPGFEPNIPSEPDDPNNDTDDFDSHESAGIEYGLTSYDLGVDAREAWARYCRCVYGTTPQQERVQAMLAALNPNAPVRRFHLEIEEGRAPMLRDVVDAKTGDLPEWDRFLPAWKEALTTWESPRANLLLLESAELLEGIPEVERLVRQRGPSQPLGYLYWIHRLRAASDWQATASAGIEAVSALPAGPVRFQASESLMAAGIAAGRDDWVLQGKREAFLSVPGERNLLVLLEEARKQNVRSGELSDAIDHLQRKGEKGGSEYVLLVEALLMAGQMGEAFEKGTTDRAVGWSYQAQDTSVLFAAVLALLAHERLDETPTIRTVARSTLDRRWMRYYDDEDESNGGEEKLRASDEVLRGLAAAFVSEEQKQSWFAWALDIGRKRVDTIVSNKHRGAYRRAAEVLVALSECLELLGRGREGKHLVAEYRNERYPRHRAFRGELDSVLSLSRRQG